ncbi:MAG: transporter substrate-binding domain-containing protein [Gammaproteobacteria bacterium]|nr:transporter substrate-binding domain-containing protein [Gammaproteobacteria bacterium]
MSRRFISCAVWAAVHVAAPQLVYANPQACTALVAVSYVDALAATAAGQEQQQQLNQNLITALAKHAQLSISLDAAQGNKALSEVRSGRVDLVVGVSLEPKQDAKLDYLQPAYTQQNYRIWRRTGEQLSLKQWPELAGLRGVRLSGSKNLIDFDRQAQLQHWPIWTVDSFDSAVQQVLDGQADYVLAETFKFQQYLARQALTDAFEMIEPPVATQEFFVAIAKESACNSAALRSTLKQALSAISAR